VDLIANHIKQGIESVRVCRRASAHVELFNRRQNGDS